MSLTTATCANHPLRDAIGVCVHCRRLVCGECTTRVDGVNHCVDCLTSRAAEDVPAQSPAKQLAWLDKGLLITGAVIFLACLRLLLELAGWEHQ